VKAEAAHVFERLVALGARPDDEVSENSEKTRERRRNSA
jgi:hypothetical protein